MTQMAQIWNAFSASFVCSVDYFLTHDCTAAVLYCPFRIRAGQARIFRHPAKLAP